MLAANRTVKRHFVYKLSTKISPRFINKVHNGSTMSTKANFSRFMRSMRSIKKIYDVSIITPRKISGEVSMTL